MTVDRRLWLVLMAAAAVMFYRLSHVDMAGDDAVYSARSIGLVDFMFTNPEYQSTPLQWFKEAPGWTHLSWHDHPLPLFLIQHVFLRAQESILFAKLPYALMALGTIFLTYLIWSFVPSGADGRGGLPAEVRPGRTKAGAATVGSPLVHNHTVGILSALFLVLNAHFIWAGRVAYMESGVLFFISLALYALMLFLENKKRWWFFGIALGLALTVKFSTAFILPTIAAYVWLRDRSVYRDTRWWGALSVAAILLLPVIIYNAAMYRATGHFSLQFVRLFHQQSPWRLSGVQTNGLGRGFIELMRNLGNLVSWPYWLLALTGAAWQTVQRRFSLPLMALFFLTIQQILIGQAGYLLTLYSIFLAPIIAITLVDIAGYLKKHGYARIRIPALAWLCAYGGFFVVNSHSLVHHIGSVGWAHSSATSDNRGVLQLDWYLDHIVASDKTLTPFDPFSTVKIVDRRLHRYLISRPNADIIKNLQHSRVILIDGNISWFARVWLMERRRFYDNTPIFTLNENKFLDQLHIEKMYYVAATAYAPLDPSINLNTRSEEMVAYLTEKKIAPLAEIRRDDGQVAFRVYEVDNQRLKITGS